MRKLHRSRFHRPGISTSLCRLLGDDVCLFIAMSGASLVVRISAARDGVSRRRAGDPPVRAISARAVDYHRLTSSASRFLASTRLANGHIMPRSGRFRCRRQAHAMLQHAPSCRDRHHAAIMPKVIKLYASRRKMPPSRRADIVLVLSG